MNVSWIFKKISKQKLYVKVSLKIFGEEYLYLDRRYWCPQISRMVTDAAHKVITAIETPALDTSQEPALSVRACC